MSADIRRLVQAQLAEDAQLGGILAKYRTGPAIFYQKAPHDSRPGWGKRRYPRLDFNVDMRHNQERKTEGTLTFNIWCNTECPEVGDQDPDRAIEARLQELIAGTFYTGSDRATVCAEWQRSDEFSFESAAAAAQNSVPEVYGLTVTFELMGFPEQVTTDPDPVQGLNDWTKRNFPEMTAIAWDELPPVWRPTDDNPAIYWRFDGAATTDRQIYAVTWYNGTFAAHILTDSVTERNRWTKAIMQTAQIEGEIILRDTSPMFIKRMTVAHGADPLRDGQLTIVGQYGVLAQREKEPAQIKLLAPKHNHIPAKKEARNNG